MNIGLQRTTLCGLGLLGGSFDSPGGPLFSGGVRVELEHGSDVGERVLFARSLGGVGGLRCVQGALDLVALHEGLEVGVLNDGAGDAPVGFGGGAGAEVAVDLVEGGKGFLSEDEESADVATWGEAEDVELVDVEGVDAGDVSEGSYDTVVLGIHDAWSEFLDVLAVAHLTSASSHASGGVDSLDIVPSTDGLEKVDSLFGLLELLSAVADNKRDFWDVVDHVTLGHDERWDTSSSDGAGHSKSSLVDVAPFVPSPPGLEWSEHATASAHITERSLSTAVGTATSDTRDTSDSSTGTPGLGTGLLASNLLHSGGLSGILAQVGVHKVDNVRSDRRAEYGRRGNLASGSAALVVDGNLRPRGGERHVSVSST